jgi:hypothetical protein
MTDYLSPSFGNTQNFGQTPSPWFTVANQFLPRNLHDVIRWSKYITTQSPTTTEVIRKLSSYPITDFVVSSKEKTTVKKYEEVFKLLSLRQTLQEIGFAYHTLGNVFISIYYPITRVARCPQCEVDYPIRKAKFLSFKKYEFVGTCPHCAYNGPFKRIDRKSFDVKEMNIIQWDPLNIVVNNNPITGRSEYYYSIPNEIRRKITSGDMLFLSSTPWSFIEAVRTNQDYKFDDDGIYHLKAPSLTTHSLNGIAVPPLISLFGLVFYQQTLRKANESIATEFLNPLRVVYPLPNGSADPSVAMSLGNFKSRMEAALKKHKRDGAHILVAPSPVGYGTVSGEGRALLVNQEIQQAEETMLLSLGVSRELLSGTTNWTSSTVGLRLLESNMDAYVCQINTLLGWMFGKTAQYLSLEDCEVKLKPFKLIDDTTMQQMFANLATAGKMSMRKFFESIGEDYDDEMENQKKEAIDRAVMEVEVTIEAEEAKTAAARKISTRNSETSSEQADFVRTCINKAMEFMPMDPGEVELQLKLMDVEDPAMAMQVRGILEGIQQASANAIAAQQGQAPQPAGGAPQPGQAPQQGDAQ